MAKRIKIDFTKTEERSGWNTRQIPEGLYKAKVAAVQETEAQDGTAMLVYAFVPEDSRFKSRRFPYYCKLQQNQLWKLRDLLVAAGETVLTMSDAIGRLYIANVNERSLRRLWLTPTPNIVAGARSRVYLGRPPYLAKPSIGRLNNLLGWNR